MVSFLTTISVVSMVMFIPGRSLPGKGGSSGISFGMQEARKRRINSALIRFIGCFFLFSSSNTNNATFNVCLIDGTALQSSYNDSDMLVPHPFTCIIRSYFVSIKTRADLTSLSFFIVFTKDSNISLIFCSFFVSIMSVVYLSFKILHININSAIMSSNTYISIDPNRINSIIACAFSIFKNFNREYSR